MLTHEQKVKQKYETLFKSENRFRKGSAYPIHKRLNFKGHHWVDIYDWLIDNISLKSGDKVLDAGCGVGYGSLLMTSARGVAVHGISLSSREVRQAKANLKEAKGAPDVQFEVRSYDQLLPDQYDVIVAIESIKHSADLDKSLNSLLNAVKSGGQIVIIEDLYQRDDLNQDAELLTKDYKLVDLFRAKDYHKILDVSCCETHDLSEYVLPKIKWKIRTKLAIADFLNKLKGRKVNDITSILRGGYYLDRLYADGLMKYKAIIYTKP